MAPASRLQSHRQQCRDPFLETSDTSRNRPTKKTKPKKYKAQHKFQEELNVAIAAAAVSWEAAHFVPMGSVGGSEPKQHQFVFGLFNYFCCLSLAAARPKRRVLWWRSVPVPPPQLRALTGSHGLGSGAMCKALLNRNPELVSGGSTLMFDGVQEQTENSTCPSTTRTEAGRLLGNLWNARVAAERSCRSRWHQFHNRVEESGT